MIVEVDNSQFRLHAELFDKRLYTDESLNRKDAIQFMEKHWFVVRIDDLNDEQVEWLETETKDYFAFLTDLFFRNPQDAMRFKLIYG